MEKTYDTIDQHGMWQMHRVCGVADHPISPIADYPIKNNWSQYDRELVYSNCGHNIFLKFIYYISIFMLLKL